ncbi:helix-hairpin-helix domain-containing protein [Rhizobium alvei]|uniref:NADH-quinone oxidoreductase subunit E n=1 Tax=Rhizobium alvei TaxID=1132659 RepID=A0ABT8YPV7_9HYPH|nr:helix-hairpin-helix domain-containing protein [Rhizobium alvei]MDO6965746.1 hypothetical protein [Rhizobium alvei]
MVGAEKQGPDETGGTDPDALLRLAEASAKIFAGQAAAMTMMTAFGLSLTGQMAGLFLGSLDKGNPDREPEELKVEPDLEPVADNVVPLRSSRKRAAPKMDDLKRISGIGPKLEKALKENGILRIADIAGWDAGQAAEFDTRLGLDGRIERDDWIGQARRLLGDA